MANYPGKITGQVPVSYQNHEINRNKMITEPKAIIKYPQAPQADKYSSIHILPKSNQRSLINMIIYQNLLHPH